MSIIKIYKNPPAIAAGLPFKNMALIDQLALQQAAMTRGKGLLYNFDDLPEEESMNVGGKSLFGKPVFCDMILTATLDGDTVSVHLLHVLTTVERSKTIVSTALAGKSGTIKEYINAEDYKVSIQGSISDKVYPVALVEQFAELCDMSVNLKVTSKYLDIFKITELVITNYSFPQTQGRENMQNFSLSCLSDEPYEFTVKNERPYYDGD